MLKLSNEKLRDIVDDHKLHLIEPASMSKEEPDMFQSSLREVLACIKYSKHDVRMKSLIEEHWLRPISGQTAKMISELTGNFLDFHEDEEVIDMCEAIKTMCEESRQEGIQQGIEQGIGQGIERGIALSVQSLMQTMKFSAEKAMEILQVDPRLRPKIMELI